MLALEPVIVARVRAALAVWTVMGFTSDKGSRSARPLASVSFADCRVADSKAGAVNVQPGYRVTLLTTKGDEAAALVDAAFVAVVGALHNWKPGEVAGRRWERLSLLLVGAPQYPEDGLVGVDLLFTTGARFDGQP